MPLLTQIWREISKHLELGEAVELIAPLLRQHTPIAGLLVRRIDLTRRQLGPVVSAWLGTSPRAAGGGGPGALREAQADYLFEWSSDAPLRRMARPGDQLAFEMLALGPGTGDTVAGLLQEEHRPAGIVALIAEPGVEFGARDFEIVAGLLEPLAAALSNDARLHEMSRLRAALEADNRALLSRLGRQDLSEAVVGAETGLRDVMHKVTQVALTDAPVLILGETGSGKEVVARAIHTQSARASGPIERVNCGAIPPGLVDSELFGHERGSFTGAVGARKGWFERADGGTLFLDEIAELQLDAQVRLLRILQDGTFERVGAQRTSRVDVRIVAATHRDLGDMVRQGRFRQDLWYRLSVFPIYLPPLRERPQDIPALAAHFGYRVGQRLAGVPLVPSQQDLELLVSYRWPGNVRELAAVIERAAILGNGTHLEIAAALGGASAAAPPPTATEQHTPGASDSPPVTKLDVAMAEHIRKALAVTRGRIEGKQGAAKLLGINPHTLRARMRKLGVAWSEYRASAHTGE